MRITKQLLHRAVSCPLERVSYLDLSSMRIPYIEQLDDCQKLHTLILQDNVIDSISNIEWCRELWIIDLSGNRIKSLQGLSRFPALGSLVLNNNSLDWNELKRISHMHLLSLSLTGNNKLTYDPHYRYHVIDIIPHVWMLDGQLVTAGERKRVQSFFTTSVTSSHPVWRKVNSQTVFVPTNLQNLLVTGIYGERTTQLMTKFPMKYSHNIELDKKRLMYLSLLMEEDMKIENEYRTQKDEEVFNIPPLQQLMEQRSIETEQCNMLLLLLVTSLEFNLPTDLMIATLKTAKLSQINGFNCQSLFLLPSHILYKTVTLLLSGAAIDREDHKEGGLYPQLYEGLQVLVSSYTKLSSNRESTSPTRPCTPATSSSTVSSYAASAPPTAPPPSHKSSSHYKQYRCLLASEVVHLMCLVPAFFHYLDSNTGVLEMVSVATNDSNVGNVINHLAWKIQNTGGNIWDLYHEIATYLLHTTTTNVFSKRHSRTASHQHKPKPASATTQLSSSIRSASSQIFNVSRKSSPHLPRRAVSAGAALQTGRRHRTLVQPELGDKVLCAPERMARIVALPEPHVAVLQLSSDIKGFTGGPPDSYFYTDPRGLVWDSRLGHWTKDDLAADLSVGRLHPEQQQLQLIRSPSPDSSTRSAAFTRPSSQLSCISEDLQTIPSVEELTLDDETIVKEEEEEGQSEVLMKVDISSKEREKRKEREGGGGEGGGGGRDSPIAMLTQRPKTPEETEVAEIHLQQHILEQYSISKTTLLQDMDPEEEKTTSTDDIASLSLEAQKITNSYSSGLSDLVVPTPTLTFPTTWSSTKSLPQSLTSSLTGKPHSCAITSPTKIRKTELTQPPPQAPLLSPTAAQQDPVTTRSPIVVYAWSPVKSGNKPKQTQVSNLRSMRERSSGHHSHSRPSSYQSSSSVILKPHPPVQTVSTYNPFQSPAVTAYKAKTKASFQNNKPTTARKGGTTRKLGDVGGITSVLGTSVW